MRADEMLPDHVNEGNFGGVSVRKGSVGAFIANHRVILDPASTSEQKTTATRDLKALVPALQALGLFEVMEIRDPAIRALIAEEQAPK